jgi:glucose/arabinose dehydrogenase
MLFGLVSACEGENEAVVILPPLGNGAGGSANAGSANGGSAGIAQVGSAGRAQVDAGNAGGSNGDAGPADSRNVFRPEERAATAELISTLRVPAGFSLNTFAEDMGEARMLAVRGPFVYVTRPQPGDVIRLQDTNGDGRADDRETVATGLPLVHGITFRGNDVYLATDKQVLLASVDGNGFFGTPSAIITNLPDGGQHPRRTLGMGPDDQLYISVGSSCDACQESNPEHATMLRAAPDGSSRTVFAKGLRNTIGFGWHPQTQQLWGMDHGSDWRGDNLPPEEFNAINEGNDYGWPYCYGNRQVDPVIQDPPTGTKAEYCATTTAPDLLNQAHDAPIGMVFYRGTSFPVAYSNNAFVAMHGSWNRFPPTGYKLVRVVFDDAGDPTGVEDFVIGFLIENGVATFGRPAGVTIAPDDSLLFTDDMNGMIYRVSYPASAGGDAGAVPNTGDGG